MPRRSFEQPSSPRNVVNIATGSPMAGNALPVLCERVRHYRELRQLDQSALAAQLGVTANAVSNWERGRARPDVNLLPRLCQALGVTLYQLYGMRDPVARPSAEEEALLADYRQLKAPMRQAVDDLVRSLLLAQEAGQAREVRCVTEYDQQLAAGVSFSAEYDDPGTPAYVYVDCIDDRADCIFTVNGNSMEPTYHSGDRVMVERLYSAGAIHPGEIGAFAEGNDLWIKEYRPDGLYSHNADYPPMTFAEDAQIALIGRVLGRLDPRAVASPEDAARYVRLHGADKR